MLLVRPVFSRHVAGSLLRSLVPTLSSPPQDSPFTRPPYCELLPAFRLTFPSPPLPCSPSPSLWSPVAGFPVTAIAPDPLSFLNTIIDNVIKTIGPKEFQSVIAKVRRDHQPVGLSRGTVVRWLQRSKRLPTTSYQLSAHRARKCACHLH